MNSAEGTPLLEVRDLSVTFNAQSRHPSRVVHDVSFDVARHETVALVGESGSGKTTIGRALLGMVKPSSGQVRLDGADIVGLKGRARRQLAQKMQVVFQDPYGSLNPSLTVGSILAEPLYAQRAMGKEDAKARIADLLERVGLPADAATRYPAHFSGGQRQRIAIARALALSPQLLVCDEPTSALDVSTQAQVLALLTELQQQSGLSFLFITHDLAVVRHFADRVLVLQQGRLVESGTAEGVCEHPTEPYTRRLVAAAPVPDPRIQKQRRLARRHAAA